jgi:hypothetical protein
MRLHLLQLGVYPGPNGAVVHARMHAGLCQTDRILASRASKAHFPEAA